MKGIFKLTSLALALVAFASCSNDDFLSSEKVQTQKTGLILNVEDMNGEITRSAYTASNGRVWQETDKFTVYDDELHKYDFYKFNKAANSFLLEGTQDLTDPKFVIFAEENAISDTKWVKADNSTEVYITIPNTMTYEELEDGAGYISNLPLWGTATKLDQTDAEGNYTISADVYFLTSILKVNLTNALNNAAAVTVFAYKDIAGTQPMAISGATKAILSKQGQALASNAVELESNEAASVTNNRITVYLPNDNLASANSKLFIPILAGKYGMLKVKYYTATEVEANQETDPTKGTIINTASTAGKAYTYVNKQMNRATPYGGATKNFDIKANTVQTLTEALQTYKTETEDVTFTVADATTAVEAPVVAPNDEKNTITLPEFACDKVTINVTQFTGANDLYIAGNDFTKSLVLNVTNGVADDIIVNLPAAAGVTINLTDGTGFGKTLSIDAPLAAVQISGKYNGGALNADAITNVGSLTFGNGTAVTTIADNLTFLAEFAGDLTVATNATIQDLTLAENHLNKRVTINGTASNITIKGTQTVSGTTLTIGSDGTAGAIAADDADNDLAITINGTAGAVTHAGTGAITLGGKCTSITSTNTSAGKITINGNANIADDYFKVATVDTKGDVEVAMAQEGGAIKTSLTMVDGKTLTFGQGYIATVIGPTGDGKKVNITLPENAVYNSIGAITNNAKFTGTSKWNGRKIGDGHPTVGVGALPAAGKTAWQTTATATIFTATAFAEKIAGDVAAATTIYNDIDLDNKTFAPAGALSQVIAGDKSKKTVDAYPTISKLTLATCAKNTTTGYGLFATAAAGAGFSNLTFNGITAATHADGGCANIGGLVGLATTGATAIAFDNVHLTGTNAITGTKLANKIGGFVGGVAGDGAEAVTFANCSVAGLTITGYNMLGGFIGDVAADSKIEFKKTTAGSTKLYNTTSNLTFTQLLNPDLVDADPTLAKVGEFIGNIANITANNIQLNVAELKNTQNYTVTNATAVAALAKFPYSDGEGVRILDIVKSQYYFGYTGNGTTITAKIIDAKTAGNTGEYVQKGKITAALAAGTKFIDFIKDYE